MKEDHHYIECAMEEAEKAYEAITYPVGAVIVDPYGNIIGRGHNHVYSEGDFTRHAEMEAIRDAGDLLMKEANLNACTLYTTMEPCLMCSGAILLARIKRVIWVLDSDVCNGALQHLRRNPGFLCDYYSQKIGELQVLAVGKGDLADECNLKFKRQMTEWMELWSGKKETRVKEWQGACKHKDEYGSKGIVGAVLG